MNIRNFKAVSALALALPLATFALGVNFFNPEAAAPAMLSQTGVYAVLNATTKTPDTAMKYFEVNAALWSDAAHKSRWIILPPGTHVIYVDSVDYFDYPNQTIFVKNFYLDSVGTDSTTRKYWETRLLVNKEDAQGNDAWYGFSYKWNSAGSDAFYVGQDRLDTAMNIYPKGLSAGLSYRKWSYPGINDCRRCHVSSSTVENGKTIQSRGVLGFYPAQLKRNLTSGTHQINSLFSAGVFIGTPPTDSMKRIRFKGIGEAIPTGDANLRFRTIDTIARSYIAANCSGCHGTRNINVSSSAPYDLNYDFFRLKPVIEFGAKGVGTDGVDDLTADTTNIAAAVTDGGRYKFILAARAAGLNTSPGAVWDMSIPSVPPQPKLITPGYPALSMMLYRQLALRRTPWRDSISYRITVSDNDPKGRKAWIFNNPWGSQAWRNDLASHETGTGGVKMTDLLEYGSDNTQMPPLATHIPDTAAMKILGEWARTYRTLVRIEGEDSIVTIRGRPVRFAAEGARIQNRMLIVPQTWNGKAVMFNVSGRSYPLAAAGKGRFAIPQSVPSGLYFFKVGSRSFRASVLQ